MDTQPGPRTGNGDGFLLSTVEACPLPSVSEGWGGLL